MLALLAVTVMVGVGAATTGATTADGQSGFPFGMVSVARGADAATLDPRSVYFELTPQPEAPDEFLSRRAAARVAAFVPEATPLPTPVAPPPPPPVPPPPVPRPRYVQPAPIVGTGQLKWPVPGGTITQYYSSYHLGLDIAAPSGRAVNAAADGVVTQSGWKTNGGGLVVTIDHGNGIVTVYNHLGSAAVAVGDTVATGQTIAVVGCTGVCSGPHVMFAVIVDGVIVNPLRLL